MGVPALKFEDQIVDNSKEFPIFNLMTRVLIHSLCPLLKSELMFGNIDSGEANEKFSYWVDANVEGDLTGQFGVGADHHTLKTLALQFKMKTPDGKPNEKEALVYLHESLAKGIEAQFGAEDFHCTLSKGSGVVQDFTFTPPARSYYFCPVETKCGVIKVYFSFQPTAHELVDEFSSKAILEPRKIRVYASQLDSLYTGIRGLENLETQLLQGPQVRSQMRTQIKKLKRMLHQLKSESLETLFLPAKKLVVDISKQQGKQIKFVSHGTWLCLDKTLLNNLYEPILHLIRNAVDHGIEEPSERERLGKPATGNIRCLAAFNEEGLRLIISDDGRGVDLPRIRERAVAKGILTQDAANRAMTDELCALIFKSGFSTRERADAISGRGLGLDIVKKGIEAVGGSIKILSTSYHGTSFEICIPLNDDFQGKRVVGIVFENQNREEEERLLLLDELSGYFERLSRALSALRKERQVISAYEAYRLAHSIKGAAGFLGWNRVASFCHHYEELLKLLAEEKSPMDDATVQVVLEAGNRLKEFCDASKSDGTYSLLQVRKVEARILQSIWAATKSDERTHLFFGKYHLKAVERFLAPLAAGKSFTAKPESDFSKAVKQPFGSMVQFSGDRKGYAGILLPEETFVKVIHPMITGAAEKGPVKRQIWSLTEFANLMGQAISELSQRAHISLQHSAPVTYYGWGQPLKILGNPTYCYECEIDGSLFYLAGDFRMPQEMVEMEPKGEPQFHPNLIMQEAVKQCQKHFSTWGLNVNWSEQPTQSDLIGFDGGITAIISCVSKQGGADSVLFLSYEPTLAQHIHNAFGANGNGSIGDQVDVYDCLNETSNIVGGLLIAELEKRKMNLELTLPTVFIGKAYVANFNRLFVTNKIIGVTPKGKFELQILVTHLAD